MPKSKPTYGQLEDRIKQLETELARKKELAGDNQEGKFLNLFAEMGQGFSLQEMLYDDAGIPCDYVTIEVNKAFVFNAILQGVNNAQGFHFRAVFISKHACVV